MSQKRQQVQSIMKNLNVNNKLKTVQKIDANTFSEEELKLFEQGGISMSDSDVDSVRGSVKMEESDDRPQRRSNQNFQTKPYEPPGKYNSIITLLEKQNAYLNSEVKRLQIAYDADKQKILTNQRIETDRLIAEIKQLKAKQAHQDAQMPGVREALSQVRDMLAGLVPEAVYLKLRDLDQSDLPLQEWLLVQVWELAYPFKKENEFQRKEIMGLREELKKYADKQQATITDLEHQQRLLNDKEDDIKRYKANYENARKAIEIELQKAQEELAILREKGARFDELHRDFKRVEQEKFLLEEKMGYYDNQRSKDGKSMVSEVYRIQDELKRKNDLLQQDKEYLTKENIGLLEKLKRLEDKLDKNEKDYLEAKNQAQEYLFQLLNLKSETSSEYEKKIYKEIQELKDKHNHELQISKQNLIDIYEKQIQFLKEAKEEVEIKKDSLEGSLKEKQYAYDQLLLDFRTLQRRVESDLSELRIQLRLKMEELDRVQHIYEDTLANLKATKQENEMQREKINILKSEYYKCQVDAKDEMTSIKAQLEVAKEQLANYEGIENEIDQAIMKASVQDYDPSNPLLGVIGQVPTSSKRRIQQALNLAQRLQAKQRECEHLQRQLKDKDKEIEKLQDEIQVSRDVMDKMNQPHSYLVAHIEERDREILKYKQLLKKSEQDYQYLKAENDNLKELFQQAQDDVQRLKIKRQNIQNIQNILLSIAQGSGDMRQGLRNAINEISEALNTRTYQDPLQFQSKYPQQTPPQKIPIREAEEEGEGPAWYRKLKSQQKKK